MTYDQIAVGDSASFEKTISESDVYLFAGIIGDFNPVHVNKRYAEATRFGRRVAHGMLTGSLFSTIFTNDIPGFGNIFISQNLNFIAPVFIGDTIKATVVVVEKLPKGRVRFECTATNQDDEVVVTGEAICLPPREEEGEKTT